MNSICYQNLSQDLLTILKETPGAFNFLEHTGKEAIPEDTALFLIGEGKPKRIPLIQQVSKKDPDLGIIVVTSHSQMKHQLNMAIRFAPFINQHVQVVDTSSTDLFKELIIREADLTMTRKKFRKTRERVIVDSFITPDIRVKSKFFDQFLSHAPIGMMLLNESHVVLDTNGYVRDLFGEDMFSRYFPEFFQDKQEIIEKLLQENLPKDDAVILTIEIPEKSVKHVQLYFSEVISANSSFRMVMLLDVTREVLAESKVQDYLSKLINHNQELEQFANILAHDLKSPLSTIQVSSDMAASVPEKEKNRFLEIIHRSANNLRQMIEGLEEIIDVRKNGKNQASQIQFREVLDKMLETYQIQIENEKIEIDADFSRVASITYIESYLTSIFHNMITNAIKYSREEEPLKVKISTEKSDRYILLKISDNGIGIDLQEHKTNMFQPFRRFTSQAKGKGIGLSIVKATIEKNNGKIAVDSTVGVGTTFYCYLCPYE